MKKYLFIAALALMAIACQKEEPKVTPSITLSSQQEVTIPTDGAIETVSFNANVAWTASIDNSAWQLSAKSGDKGDASIKVTAPQNTTNDAVVATLTIKAETATQTVKFTQLQKDALIVEVTEKEIDCNEQDFFIDVKSNIEYTAKVSDDCTWMIVSEGTKAVTTSQIHVGVDANKGEAREGSIIISGAGKNIEFVVKQAAFVPVFEVVDMTAAEDGNYYFDVPKEGGSYEFALNTNIDYEFEPYTETFPTQHVTRDGNKYKVTIDPNNEYDAHQTYVKFTLSGKDEEGQEVEVKIKVYFDQPGIISMAWRTEFFWDLYSYGGGFTTAISGDYLLVANNYNQAIHCFTKADGKYVGAIDLPFVPSGIVNDSVGNIVITTGGTYPIDETTWELIPEQQIPLQVYTLPAGSTDPAQAKCIIEYYDDFYGYGLGNVKVSGDVASEAVIVLSSAGYGSSYAVAWQIQNGEVVTTESNYTDYVTLPTPSAVYSSNYLVSMPVGSKMSDGILHAGYCSWDGDIEAMGDDMQVGFNNSWSYTAWQRTGLTLNQGWANAVMSMDIETWNGKKYIAAVSSSFFAYADWDYDGTVDGYMPGYLYIFDIDNLAAPVQVSCYEYYANEENWQYGNTCSVSLEVEDGNLVAYLLDSSASHIQKVIYPAK